jgi:hypothetical protein
MTEILDRIEEELVAAARRRATAPTPTRRRARASRRTLALAGAGALLAGGGAVAAVTTGGDAAVPSDVQRSLENTEGLAPALPDGLRVTLTVGEERATQTVVAYEADRGSGVRGSDALCVAGFSRYAPPDETGIRWLIVPCQGPWPLSRGAGLQSVPVGDGGSTSHVTAGLVPPEVRRAEILLPDGTRSAAKLSAPFTVDLAGRPGEEPVPRAPRDVLPAGGSVSARLVAAATAERPQAAVLTYADGRTERVALDGG